MTPPKDKTQEQDPQAEAEELREEIAETREGLGDTVEQLAHKADVKAQAQAQVEQVKEKRAPMAAGIAAVIGGLVLLLWLRRR